MYVLRVLSGSCDEVFVTLKCGRVDNACVGFGWSGAERNAVYDPKRVDASRHGRVLRLATDAFKAGVSPSARLSAQRHGGL